MTNLHKEIKLLVEQSLKTYQQQCAEGRYLVEKPMDYFEAKEYLENQE